MCYVVSGERETDVGGDAIAAAAAAVCYVVSGERETDVGGDAIAAAAAAQSDDVMNGDVVRDTYVDTLNLWV